MSPVCTVYSTSNRGATTGTTPLGSDTELQISSCGSVQKEPCPGSSVSHQERAHRCLWVVFRQTDCLPTSSLTHPVTSGTSRNPHVPLFAHRSHVQKCSCYPHFYSLRRKFTPIPQKQNKSLSFTLPALEFGLMYRFP